MRIATSIITLGLCLTGPVGAKSRLVPHSIIRFERPLTVRGAELREALARANDPLAVGRRIHIYVQRGKIVPPTRLATKRTYCRIEVDPERVLPDAAREALADLRDERFPISGREIEVSAPPVRADPNDYSGDKSILPGEEPRERLFEAKWARFDPKRSSRLVLQGRALDVRLESTPGNAIAAVICFKRGTEFPDDDDLEFAFQRIAKLTMARRPPSSAPPTPRVDTHPEVIAKAVSTPVSPEAPIESVETTAVALDSSRPGNAARGESEHREEKESPARAELDEALGRLPEDGSPPSSEQAARKSGEGKLPMVTPPAEVCAKDPEALEPTVVCRDGDRVTRTLLANLLAPRSGGVGAAPLNSGCDWTTDASSREIYEEDLLSLAKGRGLRCTVRKEPCRDSDDSRADGRGEGTRKARPAKREASFKPEEDLPLCKVPNGKSRGQENPAVQTEPIFSRELVWAYGRRLREDFERTRSCPARLQLLDFDVLASDPRIVGLLNPDTAPLEVETVEIPKQHLQSAAADANVAVSCGYDREGLQVLRSSFHCHGASCFEQVGNNYDCTPFHAFVSAPAVWVPGRSCDEGARRTEKMLLVSMGKDNEVFLVVRYLKTGGDPEFQLIFPRIKRAPRRVRPPMVSAPCEPARLAG